MTHKIQLSIDLKVIIPKIQLNKFQMSYLWFPKVN